MIEILALLGLSLAHSTLVPSGVLRLAENSKVIVVDKTDRQVKVFGSEPAGTYKLYAAFPADIGKVGGDKTQKNDHRTPEGIYFFLERREQPQPFELYGHLAFITDYPNVFDRLESKTGSGIWLHAIPDTVPLTRGSRGCVVVRNEAISELDRHILPGETPMIIYDNVEMVDQSVNLAKSESVRLLLEAWKSSWSAKDFDSYIQFYDSQFDGDGMNFSAWSRHKKYLKDKYQYIHVEVRNLSIFQHKDHLLIRFLQKYTSDKHSDIGTKTIYAKLTKDPQNPLRIVNESWKANESPLAERAFEVPAKSPASSVSSSVDGKPNQVN